MDAGNVVLGKRTRTPAAKYVHDLELDQLLGEDSDDEQEEEDIQAVGEDDAGSNDEEDRDKDGDGSGSNNDEEVEDGSGSDEEEELEDKEDDEGQDLDEEVWEPVPIIFLPKGAPEPGTRVLYEVSTLGRVRSLHRDTPRLVTPYVHQNRYHAYGLSYGGRAKTVLAHDLVLGTLKGPYPKSKHLWHIDDKDHDMYNNSLDNLRYFKANHNLSRSRKPRVSKGPSTSKPKPWSYVEPDRPDLLTWGQHPKLRELEVAKEGRVRYAAGYGPNGKKRGHMVKPYTRAPGHLWAKWSANGKQCSQSVHRMVFRTWVGQFPTNESAPNGKMAERLVLDHIDGSKGNNHADNPVFISHTANSRKRSGRNSNNTSRANAVHWHKDRRKWQARIRVDGRLRHLGYFVVKSDAKKARLAAEKKYNW